MTDFANIGFNQPLPHISGSRRATADNRVDMFERDLGVPHFLCSSRKFIPGFRYWQALTKQVFENIPYVLNRVKVW